MVSINDAIDVTRQYLRDEHAALCALYGEPDDDIFQARLATAIRHFAPGEDVELAVSRPPGDPRFVRERRFVVERLTPRVLFLVLRYRHARGELFRCFVSSPLHEARAAYAQNLYLAEDRGGLRIIAIYERCDGCRRTAMDGGPTCAPCGSTGFVRGSGARIDDPGELVERRRLEPPRDGLSRAAYHALDGESARGRLPE